MKTKTSIEDIKKSITKFLELNLEEKERMGELNYKNLERFSFEKIKHKYKILFTSLIATSSISPFE